MTIEVDITHPKMWTMHKALGEVIKISQSIVASLPPDAICIAPLIVNEKRPFAVICEIRDDDDDDAALLRIVLQREDLDQERFIAVDRQFQVNGNQTSEEIANELKAHLEDVLSKDAR